MAETVQVGITQPGSNQSEYQPSARSGQSDAHVYALESLERLSRIMLQEAELEIMLQRVLETVLDVFCCDRAWILFPCDPESVTCRVSIECTRPGFPSAFAALQNLPIASQLKELFHEARQTKGPIVYDSHTNHAAAEMAKQFGVQSQILTAISCQIAEPWLFGLHQCSSARRWTRNDIHLFRQIGARITDGLNLCLHNRDLRERESRFAHVSQLFGNKRIGI